MVCITIWTKIPEELTAIKKGEMMRMKRTKKGVSVETPSRDITTTPSHEYYITILMTVTSLIAGWHIKDVWSGIIALLCSLVTLWLVWDITGGVR